MGSFRNMGLKKTVIITVAAATTLMLLLIMIISYAISFTRLKKSIVSETEEALLVCSEQIQEWLDYQGDFTEDQANAAGNIGYFQEGHSRNDEFIDSVMLLNSYLLDCYTAYEDVSLYMAVTDTSTLPEGFDATSRAWYKEAKAKNSVIYSVPYVDAATGSMIFTVASPIYENKQFAGVFGCDISLDKVIELINGLKVTENGYPVLIDNNGNILVHPNGDFLSKADGSFVSADEVSGDYSEILGSFGEEVSFGLHKDYDGKTKYFAFTKLDGTDWAVGYVMPKKDIDGTLSDLGVIYIVMFIVFLALGNGAVIFVITRQMKPLRRLSETAESIAAGNLSAEIHYDSDDEIGALCSSFEECVKAMRTYVSDISEVLTAVAHGDLTVESGVEYNGDFAEIKRALDLIIAELSNIISEIDNGSSNVLLGSNQMTEGSQTLADGTTKQASAIEKISSTIADVSAKIEHTASNAAKAGELSSQTQEKVNRQDSEIKDMVNAMNEISETSKQIEKIIKTIDDIAFQTNILALNAAVEAARAGNAGKGFSIVADEVRNLASKSAEAASSTTKLINASIAAVENGSKIALGTMESMKEVKEMSTHTAELINEIASASSEQSIAIRQITSGVDQISQVIQTNSATAEETAASCSRLSDQSGMLRKQVSRFKLKNRKY